MFSFAKKSAGAASLCLAAALAVPPLAGAVDGARAVTPAAHAAGSSSRTLAQLRVATLGPRAKHPVAFVLKGSQLARGHHLRSAVLTFGDHRHRRLRSLEKAVHHIYAKPGAYVATLRIEDSAGHVSTVRRSVVVGGHDVAVIKKTVVRVSASSITAVTPADPRHETLTLKRGSTVPTRGHTLWVGRGKLDPLGIIGVVQHTAKQQDGSVSVSVVDGTLRDVYKSLRVVATSKMGQTAHIAYMSHGELRVRSASSSQVPFTCKDSDGNVLDTHGSVDVKVDLSNTHISTTVDLAARIFSFNMIAKPTFSLGVSFSGSVQCRLQTDIGLIIPVPAVPGLVVTASPYFELTATGKISASASYNPAVFLSASYISGKTDKFFQYNATATGQVSGSASVMLEGGIEVQVSAAKVAGLTVDAGPQVTVTGSDTNGQVCLKIESQIEVTAKLFAHAFGFIDAELTLFDGHFFYSKLYDKCVTGGASPPSGGGSSSPPQQGGGGSESTPSQPYLGPTVTETSGGVVQTWTDYVHAGGARGPDIGANQSVGIVCKLHGFRVANGNTWWYRIGSSPWNANYYGSADAFYNNGQTSGPLRGTPYVDDSVPDCSSSVGSDPNPGSPPVTTTPGPGKTYPETTGGVTHTFTDYHSAGGTQGPSIPSNSTVQITCKVTGFQVADGNTWWYQIASSPWNDTYYASADAFYNDGQTSGSLRGTPFVDNTVPDCSTPPPPPPSPNTYAETTGGETHTWTNYTNAGGTEGPTIQKNQTVQITCRVTGFQVADGNNWWYQIASDPWNNNFYASADAFYNNGATSGSLQGTPFYDPAVPVCGSGSATVGETTGGETHTWSNYSNAGGTQGETIGGHVTVQITCRVQGFKVADGNTWWYRIASDPWNNNFYASADAFYNNGATSGSLQGTPFYDGNVPVC